MGDNMNEVIEITKPISKRKLSTKEKRKLCISYLIILILTSFLLLIISFLLNKIEINIPLYKIYLVYIVVIIIFFLPQIISTLAGKLIFCLAEKSYLNDCMQYNNYENIKYFRDTYKDIFNANIIAYMMNLDLDNQCDLAGCVLSLVNKGYIKIDNSSLVILNDDLSKLSNSEYILMDSIINKTTYEKTINWQLETMVECYELGLIEKNSKKTKTNSKILITLLIFLVLSIIIVLSYFIKDLRFIYDIFSIPMITVIIVSAFTYIIAYSSRETGSMYKRTKYGEQLTARLFGIKEYIKDFSILEERKKEELILWQDYMVLACLFNLNKKEVEKINQSIADYIGS